MYRDTVQLATTLALSIFPCRTFAQLNIGNSGPRAPDAFQWVQPPNTTILGQYGDSPPFYPSRTYFSQGDRVSALMYDAIAAMDVSSERRAAAQKAQDFIDLLTLEEKTWLVTGVPGPCIGNIEAIPRLNFTGICLQDGPNAVRPADFVSVFPSGLTIASSWDRELIYERYHALGLEYRGKGAQVALAPVGGPLGRSAYGGRNWEGFSPDPYLTGVAMESSVKGLQDAGVQATIKHWLLYEQETQRSYTNFANGTIRHSTYSSNANDRVIHELYMWPFANAIRAEASAAMCSYNRVNGSYACQNSKLLNGLLKEELGFQGYVMTDWSGLHSGVASVEAGTDMDQPGFIAPSVSLPGQNRLSSYFGGNITSAVRNGTILESRLDDMIKRIMTPYYFLHQDEDFPLTDPAMGYYNTQFTLKEWSAESFVFGAKSRDVRQDHGDLIRRHAAESSVLLKNTKDTLPLSSPRNIAIFGSDAGPNTQGPFIRGSSQFGTLAIGGGSGNGRFTYLANPLEALQTRAKQDNALVQSWLNNTLIISSNVTTLLGASTPDVCIVFLKTRATEQLDREYLHVDQDGDRVVDSVAKACPSTVIVTHSGGLNTMPWSGHPNVTAILAAHYPGQESGNSIVDILYGKISPSGKLPYTIPLSENDLNTFPTTNITTSGVDDWQSWYTEGLEIDYRYFDAQNMSVRYEFGFGLSYTNFDMGELRIQRTDIGTDVPAPPPDMQTRPGGNPALWDVLFEAQVVLRNTGHRSGATVAQLYISYPEDLGEPPKQLRGFEKIYLTPDEAQTITLPLMRRDLSYWDVIQQKWLMSTGEYGLHVGFSSRDIRGSLSFYPVNK